MQKTQVGSHLFTLRVWLEDVGHGRSELRGTLTHVLTGKTGHFRDWATLAQLIESFVTSAARTQTPSDMERTSYDNLSF